MKAQILNEYHDVFEVYAWFGYFSSISTQTKTQMIPSSSFSFVQFRI